MKHSSMLSAALVAAALGGSALVKSALAREHVSPAIQASSAHAPSGGASRAVAGVATYTDVLRDGDFTDVYVPLQQGVRYHFAGACDLDCSDLDLKLFGPGGTLLEDDLDPDDTPVMDHTAGQTATYRVRVIMARCTANPCRWELDVSRDDDDGDAVARGRAPVQRRSVTLAGLIRHAGQASVPSRRRS